MVSENTATEMPSSKKLKESRNKRNCRAVNSSEAQESAKDSRKPTLTDFESEVIIAHPIPLTSENEMIDSAKANIIDVLHSNEVSTRHIDNCLLVENPRGFDHAGRLSQLGCIENSNRDLRTDMDRLKEEAKGLAQELVEQARELSDARL